MQVVLVFISLVYPPQLTVMQDATATTYSINCPPGTDSSDCGMGPGLTLIAGPKTTMILDAPDLDL